MRSSFTCNQQASQASKPIFSSSHLSGKIYGDECTILLEVSLVKAFQNILQWFSGLAIVNKNQGPNKEEINRGMWPFMWRSQHYRENGINFTFHHLQFLFFMMCEFGCMNQKADQGAMSICLPILGHRSPSPSHFLSGVATILLLVTNSFRQSIKKTMRFFHSLFMNVNGFGMQFNLCHNLNRTTLIINRP